MTDAEQEELRNERTINTGASDHVFKPKNKRRGGEKTAESEFSRGGIPKVASHYRHFSLSLALSRSRSLCFSCSYRISQLKKSARCPAPSLASMLLLLFSFSSSGYAQKIIMTTNDRLKQGRASVKKIKNKKIIKIARLELKMTAEAARAPGRSLSLSCAS